MYEGTGLPRQRMPAGREVDCLILQPREAPSPSARLEWDVLMSEFCMFSELLRQSPDCRTVYKGHQHTENSDDRRNEKCGTICASSCVGSCQNRRSHNSGDAESDPHDAVIDGIVLASKLICTKAREYTHESSKANSCKNQACHQCCDGGRDIRHMIAPMSRSMSSHIRPSISPRRKPVDSAMRQKVLRRRTRR